MIHFGTCSLANDGLTLIVEHDPNGCVEDDWNAAIDYARREFRSEPLDPDTFFSSGKTDIYPMLKR